MSECDDPSCPGCKTERYVAEMKETGMPPDEIVECFFDYLKEAFQEAEIHVALMAEETLH